MKNRTPILLRNPKYTEANQKNKLLHKEKVCALVSKKFNNNYNIDIKNNMSYNKLEG